MQNNGFRGAVRARASGVVFVVSFFFAMGSALLCAPSYAQIVAHPGALAAHLPQITAARNGVPLVNIAAPSAGGVSRNQFSQFDVDKSGVILNNGTGNNLTRIGGWVPGNPQLGARSARVIVGEVLSTKRSVLQGYLEVAGPRADVIVANPSGITCNGCGFINTSRATLSTGLPVYDSFGRLTGWQVKKGEILVGAGGLDAREAEELDLFARSIKVQGLVRSQQIYGVASTNAIDHETLRAEAIEADPDEPKPLMAIDVSRLGNFYANQIYLIGTEKDLGFSSDGSLSATAGRLEIDINGDVKYRSASAQEDVRIISRREGTGKVTMGEQTASESGHVIVQAERIENTGKVRAGGGEEAGTTLLIARDIENTATGDLLTEDTILRATGQVTNRGVIDGRRVRIDANTLANLGTGRIYGDRIGIKARSLVNHAEVIAGKKTAATIAARERLDLGVDTISNRGGSLIFSAGSAGIGKTLDADGPAALRACILYRPCLAKLALSATAFAAIAQQQEKISAAHPGVDADDAFAFAVIDYLGSLVTGTPMHDPIGPNHTGGTETSAPAGSGGTSSPAVPKPNAGNTGGTQLDRDKENSEFNGYGAGIQPEIEQNVYAWNPQLSRLQLPPGIDGDGAQHILWGDRPESGGHLWPGAPGKTPFPASWDAQKVLDKVAEIVADPRSSRRVLQNQRVVVTGEREGVEILVVIEPAHRNGGRVVTGYPTNLPRNSP